MKKLQLKKEVVESLNNVEQRNIRGGDLTDAILISYYASCTSCNICPSENGCPGVPKTEGDMISYKDHLPIQHQTQASCFYGC